MQGYTSSALRVVGASLSAVAFAAGMPGQAEASPTSGEIGSGTPEATQVLEAKAPKKCSINRQVKLDLIKKPNTKRGRVNFTLKAQTCAATRPALLEDVKLVEAGPGKEKHTWKVDEFPPDTKQFRKFSVPNKSSAKATEKDKIIRLKALAKNDRVIGFKKYKLKYDATGKIAKVQEVSADGAGRQGSPAAKGDQKESCTPNPNLEIGVQQDDIFVFEQHGIKREEALRKAKEVYGATALRINLIYGMVQRYGIDRYVDAVHTAQQHGFKVQVNIMPTPSYQPELTQDLSYQVPNVDVMYAFSKSSAERMGPNVTYAPHNEPNHPTFSASQSMAEFAALYQASVNGIRTVHPEARIAAGELDQRNLSSWWKFITQDLTPKPAVATVHPYGDAIFRLCDLVNQSELPVEATEYGNFSTEPDQAAKNQRAIELAKAAGVHAFYWYGLFHVPKPNTGVVPLP